MRLKKKISMKLILVIVLTTVFFSLVGCSGEKDTDVDSDVDSGGGKVSISGKITPYAGSPDLTLATLQLKKDGDAVGEVVNPSSNGNYTLTSSDSGTGYTITASLEGYYDNSTLEFEMTDENVEEKNIILQRKEPVITTPTYTTITKGTEGVDVVVKLSDVSTLGDTFKEDGVVTDPKNWVIDTNDTGLELEKIIRNGNTQVTLIFTGTASKTRSFTIQAKSEAINSISNLGSNELYFSIVEDGYVASSVPELDTYYAKNTNVDGEMKAVVVIVHGLAEHLGRYNYVVERLNESGYGVYRFDNKGHGRTEKAIVDGKVVDGYVEDFHEYMDDADILVNMAKKENPDKKVYMLGHSMGGRLVALYGMKYPEQLAGQILSGPTGAYSEDLIKFENDENDSPYGGIHATEMMENSLTGTVCRDAAIRAQYAADPLNLKAFARKLRQEYTVDGGVYLRDNVADYNYPILIVHGGDDRIVPPAASEWFYNNIASTDKERIVYENSYHEIMNERIEKVQVLDDIIRWLNDRV